MKFAILTRPDYRSPRILAETLKAQLEAYNIQVEIFFEIKILNHLVDYKKSKLHFHFWLKKKIKNFIPDNRLIKKLKKFDAIIISECSPNIFWQQLYNIEKFNNKIQKPVVFYEVYYIGNAPHQVIKLKESLDALLEKFDYHLAISEIGEIRQKPSEQWFAIGLYAKSWNLFPSIKKEFIAIIDFPQPGFELYRQMQINALVKAGIKFISLEGEYTTNELREIYNKGAIYFLQSFEAFGLSILECLCTGNQIFTADVNWPLSWRLNTKEHNDAKELLPECFTVYTDEDDLVSKLISYKACYDPEQAPQKNFNLLLKYYPSFYHGNEIEITRLLQKLDVITTANA